MKTLNFEQVPIPGRAVYINRETGAVIGDGKGFTQAELVLLSGLAEQATAPSIYAADELEKMKRAEADVHHCAVLRDAALQRVLDALQELRATAERFSGATDASGKMTNDAANAIAEARKTLRDAQVTHEVAADEEGAARVRWTKTCIQARDAAQIRENARVAAQAAAAAEREALASRTIAGRARAALRSIAETLGVQPQVRK